MKVIIVDDSRKDLAQARRALAKVLPDVEVTEYDPEQQGAPRSSFNWGLYDLMLIEQDLGTASTGLEWIRRYSHISGFPPVILLADEGDIYFGAQAVQEGASEVLLNRDLAGERLARSVRQALARRPFRSDPTGAATMAVDASILRGVAALQAKATPDGSAIGYRFQRLIGQGAFSRLYLAEPASGGSPLVLKILDLTNLADPKLVERFAREAELIAAINSPRVVRFVSHGFTATYGYIAMEFLAAGDLKQRLVSGLGVAQVIDYARQIAEGLTAIHAHGIIHRDLKPGNILFRSDDRLALADFGISRRLEENSDLTRMGDPIGTPSYFSPEQGTGQPTDHRSDLYSLGVILFEMLTRRKPFRADNAAAMIHQHLHAPVPRLPATLTGFQPLLDRLLAKEPAERPDSAAQFLSLLHQITPELHPAP
jgi:serine/threonine protein kinase